jgi:hypothetical protein
MSAKGDQRLRLADVPRLDNPDALGALERLLAPLPDRVVLLANNPLLLPALPRLRLDARTLLVQFNATPFDGLLAAQPGRRLYVMTHHELRFFGFDDAGWPRLPLLARATPPPGFLFCGRDLRQLAGFLAALPPEVACLQVPEKRWLLPDYPRGRSPSTGFLMAALLVALNRRRLAAGQPALALELVGFTAYRRGALALHDWWYEQRWLRRQPGLKLEAAGVREGGAALRAAAWCLSHWRSRLRGWVARLRGKD